MTDHENQETRPDRRSVLILGLAVLTGAAVLYREFRQAPDPDPDALTVTEAHDMAKAGHVLLIDIRRPDEWRQTGVPQGAQPIDMRREDFLAALHQAAGQDLSRPIALICARGGRSARLAGRLDAAGFSNVTDVPEGLLGSAAGPGWLATGLPVQPHPAAAQ